jgi:hypothetical protein
MNKSKQVDVIRKHNAELSKRLEELSKQLDDMRFKLEFDSQLNKEGYQRARNLIDDLEKIKQEWLVALDDLNEKREKYSCLISDVEKMKKIMIGMGFNIPWYKKIIAKLKK